MPSITILVFDSVMLSKKSHFWFDSAKVMSPRMPMMRLEEENTIINIKKIVWFWKNTSSYMFISLWKNLITFRNCKQQQSFIKIGWTSVVILYVHQLIFLFQINSCIIHSDNQFVIKQLEKSFTFRIFQATSDLPRGQ